MPRVVDWIPGRVLYHLHSLGAAGTARANPNVDAQEPCGRGLAHIEPWLDHVAGLGCGGVLLTPIFVASTHGYDTVDPFRIDQRLGDDDDFAAFVDACHARGLKLILDGVFNHVGRDFAPFRDVLTNQRDSAYADWFRLDFSRDDGDGFGYATFEGHRELVALNHRSEAVLEWAVAVARHWLERGADGWRQDAAYAILRPFLASLNDRIRAQHPDAFLFGEVIHGDYGAFVADTQLDAVTQYELHKAIWSSLNDGNLFELAWALERHRTFVATFAPVTFVGNHDVTRLASKLHNPKHAGHALTILFTVPGVPCIYYGDELGWPGVKEDRAGGDDVIRPPLPADARPAGDEQHHLLDVHRQFVALRRDCPWLTTATVEVRTRANRQITYTVSGDAGALLVMLDVDNGPVFSPDGWQPVVTGPGWLIASRQSG